jgi:hypothetical protein
VRELVRKLAKIVREHKQTRDEELSLSTTG